jgi:Glyoxalase/Bleomycin resistance protein/Dioxygenase superfamily
MLEPPYAINETQLSNTFIGKVLQICIVTRGYRRTIEGLSRMGIGPWTIRRADESNLSEMLYRGNPTPSALYVCMANNGNMNWEVIEPIGGSSLWQDFLDRHEEGIHHVAVDCNGLPYDAAVRAFEAHGYRSLQSGVFLGAVRFNYFATEEDTKTIFEIFDVQRGFVFPAADGTFP